MKGFYTKFYIISTIQVKEQEQKNSLLHLNITLLILPWTSLPGSVYSELIWSFYMPHAS